MLLSLPLSTTDETETSLVFDCRVKHSSHRPGLSGVSPKGGEHSEIQGWLGSIGGVTVGLSFVDVDAILLYSVRCWYEEPGKRVRHYL